MKKVGIIMKIFKKVLFGLLIIIVASVYSYGIWPRAIYNTDIGANSYEITDSLSNNAILEQRFVCEDNGMCGLSIKLTKQMNQRIGNYEWEITEEESSERIGKGSINESSTENRDFESKSSQKKGNIELKFAKQDDSKDKAYILTIKASNVDDAVSAAVYITEKDKAGTELAVNGKDIDRASVIKINYQRFNVETFIVFLGIVVYLVLFVRFMYKLFK